MAGTSGGKYPAIRAHLQKNIGDVYREMDTSFAGFPAEDKTDPEACTSTIFTADRVALLVKKVEADELFFTLCSASLLSLR
jgi:hypothetical protein